MIVDLPEPTGPTIIVKVQGLIVMLSGPAVTECLSLQPAVRLSAKRTALLRAPLSSMKSLDSLAMEMLFVTSDLILEMSVSKDPDKDVVDCPGGGARSSCLDAVCRKVLILSIDPIAVATPAEASTKIDIGVARRVKSVKDVKAWLEVRPSPPLDLSIKAQMANEITGDIEIFVYAAESNMSVAVI